VITAPRQHWFDVAARGPEPRRRLAWYEWGDPSNPRVALCVHGLSRNARDFDWLADALSATHRVIAIDCPGRGLSDRLKETASYQILTYEADALALIGALGIGSVDWIGTSMGGILGMLIGAGKQAGLIRRLVLNDIGPYLPGKAMDRVGTYVGMAPRFATLDDAYAYQAGVNADWANMSEAQRRHITTHAARALPGGGYEIHYDPRIGDYLHKGPVPDLVIWERYDAVRAPTLVLRGTLSDILLPETAADMTRRGPRATLVEVPGIGHTPSLMTERQVEAVNRFLAT